MRKPAVPTILLQARLPAETEQLRRKLEAELKLSASQLIKRALISLERELHAQSQPAE